MPCTAASSTRSPSRSKAFCSTAATVSPACIELGLVPEAVIYDGDAEAFALATNIARRHLSKGQRAMIAAQARRLLKNNTQAEAAEAIGVQRSYLAQADTESFLKKDSLSQADIAQSVGVAQSYIGH